MKHQAKWSFEVSIYNLAPTNQSNSDLLGKISHDNLWSNWKKITTLNKKAPEKVLPKIHTLAGWGFASLMITWKLAFPLTNITKPPRKGFQTSKKICLLDTETHLTDSKKRSKMSWFLQFFCGISCCPLKRIYFELMFFFLKYRQFQGKQRTPQASSLASFQANR